MRVAFLPAVGSSIGGGHVVRAIALADAITASGGSCTFLLRENALATVPFLSRSKSLPVPVPADPAAAIDIARQHAPFDWIVIDDYALARSDETLWRSIAKKIAVIDDLADRHHDCDLLLDSTPERRARDYADLASSNTRLLLGTAYPPLRAEFAMKRPFALAHREHTERPCRLLVSFGLTDPGGITAHAVGAIAPIMPELHLDVVLGSRTQSARIIAAAEYPNVRMHIDPPSMPDLMVQTDMALGAGGSTAWERACTALPSIALILADNQRSLAKRLAARNATIAVEMGPSCWEQVLSALSNFVGNVQDWRAMGLRAALACDALGANRVALELDPPLSKRGCPVQLRPATWDDKDLIFAWQAMPGAREFSGNPKPPAPGEHDIWMARKLDSPSCVFSVIEESGIPMGVLRMDQRLDGSFITSILLADEAKNRGIGQAALRAGIRLMREHTLWAKIDTRNKSSLHIFTKLGFTLQDNDAYKRVP